MKTEVRLHCRWKRIERGGGGKVNHAGPKSSPPASVLANNDHCPADTRPLEMISGHKSLAFHFKLSTRCPTRLGTRSSPLGRARVWGSREIETPVAFIDSLFEDSMYLVQGDSGWINRGIV